MILHVSGFKDKHLARSFFDYEKSRGVIVLLKDEQNGLFSLKKGKRNFLPVFVKL